MATKKTTKIRKPKKYKVTFEAFITVHPEEVDTERTTFDDVAWDKAEEFESDMKDAMFNSYVDQRGISLLDVKPTRR